MNLPDLELNLSAAVRKVMKSEGISPEEMAVMLKKAAITTHERGNRRFHSWIFDIQGDNVRRMSKDEMVHRDIPGSLNISVVEECEFCDGAGCRECGYAGEVMHHYVARKR